MTIKRHRCNAMNESILRYIEEFIPRYRCVTVKFETRPHDNHRYIQLSCELIGPANEIENIRDSFTNTMAQIGETSGGPLMSPAIVPTGPYSRYHVPMYQFNGKPEHMFLAFIPFYTRGMENTYAMKSMRDIHTMTQYLGTKYCETHPSTSIRHMIAHDVPVRMFTDNMPALWEYKICTYIHPPGWLNEIFYATPTRGPRSISAQYNFSLKF
jgi:hypothetical protein